MKRIDLIATVSLLALTTLASAAAPPPPPAYVPAGHPDPYVRQGRRSGAAVGAASGAAIGKKTKEVSTWGGAAIGTAVGGLAGDRRGKMNSMYYGRGYRYYYRESEGKSHADKGTVGCQIVDEAAASVVHVKVAIAEFDGGAGREMPAQRAVELPGQVGPHPEAPDIGPADGVKPVREIVSSAYAHEWVHPILRGGNLAGNRVPKRRLDRAGQVLLCAGYSPLNLLADAGFRRGCECAGFIRLFLDLRPCHCADGLRDRAIGSLENINETRQIRMIFQHLVHPVLNPRERGVCNTALGSCDGF